MTNEKLKLNFPNNGGDVFDNRNNEIFFSYSGKFSNTTNDINELSIEQFDAHVPIGYKSILICQRIKLFSHGDVIGEFDYKNEISGEFILLTDNEYKLYVQNWKREIETAIFYKPNSIELSISSSIWKDLQECADYGIKLSEINNCNIIVASVIEVINWH